MSMRSFFTVAAVVLMVCAVNVGADEIYNESGDGPLSTDPANPTVVTLISASDFVSGTGASPATSAFFGFLVPVGDTVSSIVVDPGSGGWVTGAIWFDTNGSGVIDCGVYDIQGPTEILDGANCLTSITSGAYTMGLTMVADTVPWTATITSTVPVSLQSFSVE